MESPDTIHGRMKEGAHLAGYGATRAMDNLKWLLEEERYKELSAEYGDVNAFLRDTKQAFHLLRIDPEERKQIAELVKELQPQASQRAIADMVGASPATIGADLGTIERDRSVETSTPDTVEMEETVETSTPQPWTTKDFDPAKQGRRGKIIPDSTGDEWWTPAEYIESVRVVLGEIELDPASCNTANSIVKAGTFYDEEDNGLLQPWFGNVFMNPPYSANKEFNEKMQYEYEIGNVKQAVVLVGAHGIETQWFKKYWGEVLCFTGHRIKFNTPAGQAKAGNISGSVFIYLGDNQKEFANEFDPKHGFVVKRWLD